ALSRKTKRLQALLHDDSACELVVVALAEPAVIAETERLIDKLRELGIPCHHIVLNQLAPTSPTRLTQRLKSRFPELELIEIDRRPKPIQGLPALGQLAA